VRPERGPMHSSRLTALVLVASLAGPAAPAFASSSAIRKAIYRECQTASIKGTYSQADYADALRNIQTDLDEYSDCRDVIRRAQLAAAGTKTSPSSKRSGTAALGGGAGGGTTPPAADTPASSGGTATQILAAASPAEQAAVTEAVEQSGDAPVLVGGESVSPDEAGLSPAGAGNVIPTPLAAALVLLALGLVGAVGWSVRSGGFVRRTAS